MTSILVRKTGDTWAEWHETVLATQLQNTFTAVYGDGRSVETACDPYPVEIPLNGDSIRGFYDNGIWSLEEVVAVGGLIAVPFVLPEGKQIAGSPSYSEHPDGSVRQSFPVEDIPPPPAPPSAAEKVNNLLSGYGLTLEELKGVLGVS